MSILKYLRDSLADDERLTTEPTCASGGENKNACSISIAEFESGRLDRPLTENLFEKYSKNSKTKILKEADAPSTKNSSHLEIISVVLYPLRYTRTKNGFEHGFYRPKYIYPLCIPAHLDENGFLSVNSSTPPFISRLYLSPQGLETNYPEIATIDDHETFQSQNSITVSMDESEDQTFLEKQKRWPEVLNFSNLLWHKLFGCDLYDLKIPDYVVDKDVSLVAEDLCQGPNRHLFRLYDYLQEKDVKTPLLKSFLEKSSTQETQIRLANSKDLHVNPHIIAQMNEKPSLSSSQEQVMDYFFTHENDPFLTVNGPPGTGKTTLIQSLVADRWVKAALHQTEPPIIVATSANNNAVTNILDSFKTQQSSQDNSLLKRWLPDVPGFGLYCVSNSKKNDVIKNKKSWSIVTPADTITAYKDGDEKTAINLESKEYFESAVTKFRENFYAYYNENISELPKIVDYLHHALQSKVHELTLGSTYQKLLLEPFDEIGIQKSLTTAQADLEKWVSKKRAFKEFESLLPWYVLASTNNALFRWLFGKQLNNKLGNFCLEELGEHTPENIQIHLVERVLSQNIRTLNEKIAAAIAKQQERRTRQNQWEAWCTRHNLKDSPETLKSMLNNHTFRWEIFYIATHYWEARWLVEMDLKFKLGDSSDKADDIQWRRHAKLMPCFVSTLFMLPNFFQNGLSYNFNLIDYLIFDEAGQISPYKAAPNFALAKQAIIIGDRKQLEPILNIPQTLDIGNCKRSQLFTNNNQESLKEEFDQIKQEKEQYKEFLKTGLSATHSSLMNRAHALCHFKTKTEMIETGFLLTEHWRCVPPIANYCNQLAYHGCLEAMRPAISIQDRLYPALGYVHIPSFLMTKPLSSERKNKYEAQILCQWLSQNAERLMQHYSGKALSEIVAIITPFKAQTTLLKKMIADLKLDDKITIGTVHSLQGAERPIVLFSLVYSAGDSLKFIDKKVNFFNVALSRAKDSFLLFGDMGCLKTTSSTSALGQLAQQLFADEDNEITDFRLPVEKIIKTEKFTFLETLEHHRQALKDCLQNAQERVLIISPFISINAINADDLRSWIGDAVARGVVVCVILDIYLNVNIEQGSSRIHSIKENALQGCRELVKAGAIVVPHAHVHDKILCMDDEIIIIGSFNWLSASRQSDYARRETSTFLRRSPQVYEQIQKFWQRVSLKDIDNIKQLYDSKFQSGYNDSFLEQFIHKIREINIGNNSN